MYIKPSISQLIQRKFNIYIVCLVLFGVRTVRSVNAFTYTKRITSLYLLLQLMRYLTLLLLSYCFKFLYSFSEIINLLKNNLIKFFN